MTVCAITSLLVVCTSRFVIPDTSPYITAVARAIVLPNASISRLEGQHRWPSWQRHRAAEAALKLVAISIVKRGIRFTALVASPKQHNSRFAQYLSLKVIVLSGPLIRLRNLFHSVRVLQRVPFPWAIADFFPMRGKFRRQDPKMVCAADLFRSEMNRPSFEHLATVSLLACSKRADMTHNEAQQVLVASIQSTHAEKQAVRP